MSLPSHIYQFRPGGGHPATPNKPPNKFPRVHMRRVDHAIMIVDKTATGKYRVAIGSPKLGVGTGLGEVPIEKLMRLIKETVDKAEARRAFAASDWSDIRKMLR